MFLVVISILEWCCLLAVSWLEALSLKLLKSSVTQNRSNYSKQVLFLQTRYPTIILIWKTNFRTYKREYWSYQSLPIYWSTGVFFASKYFSKTDQLCEKFNPVACFTHALPDHRQQHPDEFCHIFTEIDEIVIMIKINKWIIIWI